ncbi:DUF1206 domain-containing protein [Thalassiella azotivora]
MDVSQKAQQVGESHALEVVARVGYAVSGGLHLIIGVIAVQVALGTSGSSPDQSGALQQVASAPFGQAALWVAAAALAALGLYQLTEAAVGGRRVAADERTAERVKAAAKGVTYLVLAGLTVTYATGSGGSGGSGGSRTSDVTAQVMQSTAGRVLVGLVGVGIVAVGAYHVYKGVTKKFLEDLRTTGPGAVGDAVTWLGVAGYCAKGVALAVTGFLFVLAAWQADPSEARGLDGALRTLAAQPFGTALLVAVGVGFVAYGVYSFARARYARM